jgi:protoheme IX farnesyltransferase
MNPIRATALAGSASTISDYLELCKLRLTSLVLFTTGVGFVMGHRGGLSPAFLVDLIQTILGTGLVACGSMVLNQVLERDTDARMHRTQSRPLPQGRVRVFEATVFGLLLSVIGVAALVLMVNGLTAILAVVTTATYLFLYTPMKRFTSLCTLAGAISGALPPMMGYTASAGVITAEAWVLFTILFIWQIPHFLAIAWLYREDYARGGQMMLPVIEPNGVSTARQMVWFTLTLLLASLMPTVLGMTGPVYFAVATLLGGAFLMCGLVVAVVRDKTSARRMFLASVIYLPLLLTVMMIDQR